MYVSGKNMASVAKTELANLSGIQEEMHLPKKNDIDSNFFIEDYPLAWYSRQLIQFESLTTSDNKVRFSPPEGAIFLHSSFLHQLIPEISVRDEYIDTVQIRWTDYVGINSIVNAVLKIDSNEPMSFPGGWCDVYTQFFRKAGFSKEILEKVGQTPELINWSSSLPEYECSTYQPFFYGRSLADALPLNLNPPTKVATTVHHIYTLRNKVCNLLRMRQKIDSKWEDIAFNPGYIVGPDTIENPELWGRFSYNTQEEIDHYRCQKEGVVRIYDDIVHITSENDEDVGKVILKTLSECTMPCKAMFWMCENTSASELNCHSNFTTNSFSIEEGKYPMKHSTLSYSGKNQDRFVKIPTSQLDFDECLVSFPSPPVNKGYQCYSFCVNPLSRIDVGVVLNDVNAKLNVCLRSDIPTGDKFRLHIFMMVTRKLTFVKDESGRFVSHINE